MPDSYTLKLVSKAKNAGIDALYATGKLSKNTVNAFGENGFYFENKNELINVLTGKTDRQVRWC